MSTAAVAATEDDIRQAEERLAELRLDVEAVTLELEAGYARQSVLSDQVLRLEEETAAVEVEHAAAVAALEDVAVRLYMDVASGDGVSAVLSTDEEIFAAAVAYLSTAADDSEDAIDRYAALATDLDARRARLAEALALQESADAELAGLASEVLSALEEQADRVRELEELRAGELAFLATSTTTTTAAPTTTIASTTTTTAPTTTTTAPTSTTTAPTTTTTTAPASTTTTAPSTTTTAPTTTTTTLPPAPPTSGGACPVAGPVSFVDSWGAPRSGGRAHEGVDMISPRGTPIAAIRAGTITQARQSTLGGITLWLRSDDGDEYYYAHLEGYAAGIGAGVRVEEGAIIAFNGSSGNAPDYLPHLHFEHHPGGGPAVNPYPLVKGICG